LVSGLHVTYKVLCLATDMVSYVTFCKLGKKDKGGVKVYEQGEMNKIALPDQVFIMAAFNHGSQVVIGKFLR